MIFGDKLVFMVNVKWRLYWCVRVWLWNETVAIQCKLWKLIHHWKQKYITWLLNQNDRILTWYRRFLSWRHTYCDQWKDSNRISQYCQNALKPNGQKRYTKCTNIKKKCFDDDSILCQYWGIWALCREWEKLNGTMITKSSTVHSWNSQNNTKRSLIHFW